MTIFIACGVTRGAGHKTFQTAGILNTVFVDASDTYTLSPDTTSPEISEAGHSVSESSLPPAKKSFALSDKENMADQRPTPVQAPPRPRQPAKAP